MGKKNSSIWEVRIENKSDTYQTSSSVYADAQNTQVATCKKKANIIWREERSERG